MEPISRRLFLVGSIAVAAGACSGDDDATTAGSGEVSLPPISADTPPADTTSAETGTSLPAAALPSDPFTLGVASGDPTPTSVVLWTRLAPEPLATGGGMPSDDIAVDWEVADDAAFDAITARGSTVALRSQAHSVHVRADVAGGAHHYRFHAGGFTSPVGFTRTSPAPDTSPESVRFASASCQHYEDGYYIAHRDIAQQAPDFVVFLGDYIYEGAQGEIGVDGNVRGHGTGECVTLDDYRARYALYKADPDLRAAHQAAPWWVTWDDHEVENNYAAGVPQGADGEAAFAERRRNAYQAWWEHQPVDLPPPSADVDAEFRIYRGMRWGSLLSLAMLDGRQYRSDQVCGGQTLDLDPACAETFDPARTMLGDAQESWLFDHLAAGATTWNAIGQQTIFGDVTLGGAVLNYDQWDGYPVQRNRIVDRLATDAVPNVVVLTGDIHFAGTGIVRSGGRGTGTPVGVEFVATSISSGGRIDPAVTEVVRAIPDIVDVELEHRGYILHTVTPARWEAQYRMVDTVKETESDVYQHAVYRVEVGTNLVTIADGVRRE